MLEDHTIAPKLWVFCQETNKAVARTITISNFPKLWAPSLCEDSIFGRRDDFLPRFHNTLIPFCDKQVDGLRGWDPSERTI